MRKKTLNNYKKKKGGNTIISNIIGDKPGYFITENLEEEVDKGNKEVILTKYKINKEDAEEDYLKKERIKNGEEENTIKGFERFQNFIIKIVGPFIYSIGNVLSYLINILFKLFEIFWKIFLFIVKNLTNLATVIINIFGGFVNLIMKGRGVILVVVIFVLLIGLIIFFVVFKGQLPNLFEGKDIMKNSNGQITVFKDIKQETPYTILSKQLMNLIPIPQEYYQQYSSLLNSFNSLFGKDIISSNIDTIDREEIIEGRYDGIFHIKKFEDTTDNIYSIVKPKEITISITADDLANSDYYKLPTKIREESKYNFNNFNTINIPLNTCNGLYIHNIDNGYYVKADKTNQQINTGKYRPFITSNIVNSDNSVNTIYNINHIPIDKFLYSDKDNLNPNILKTKIFDISDDGSFRYPYKYVDKMNEKLKT